MEWKLRKGKVRKNKKKVNDRLGEMKGKRKKAINRAKLLINLRSVNDDVRNWFTPLSNYPAKLFLCGGRAPVTPLRTINDLTFISRFLPLPPPRPVVHCWSSIRPFHLIRLRSIKSQKKYVFERAAFAPTLPPPLRRQSPTFSRARSYSSFDQRPSLLSRSKTDENRHYSRFLWTNRSTGCPSTEIKRWKRNHFGRIFATIKKASSKPSSF